MASRSQPHELASVDDPEVDIDRLVGDVRADAERRRGARIEVDEDGASGGTQPHRVAGPWRSPLESTMTIRPYGDVGGGRVTAAVRRAVRRALRWYLWPVTGRLSDHNRAVAGVLAENQRQLARVRVECERVSLDAELVERSGPHRRPGA